MLKTKHTYKKRESKSCFYLHILTNEMKKQFLQHQCTKFFLSINRTLISINLFRFIQISFSEIFQNEMLKHNNFINFALWKSRYIWFEIKKFDVMISLNTKTKVRTSSILAFNIRHVIYDDFILRLWRCFMFFFDDQSAWRNFWNRLDDRSKQNFFKLNFSIFKNELVINEIERINEFREIVYVKLEKKTISLNSIRIFCFILFFWIN